MKTSAYIHCSTRCEELAKLAFGWTPPSLSDDCPEEIDVSDSFGGCCGLVLLLACLRSVERFFLRYLSLVVGFTPPFRRPDDEDDDGFGAW